MKNKLVNELDMFVAIKNHMHKNELIWENVKEIGKALNKFNQNIEEIQDLPVGSDINLGDLTIRKEECRKALVKEAAPVINVLKVFAKDVKDKSLIKKIKSLNKNYKDLKDNKLIDFCKIIFKESKKHYNKAISGSNKNSSKVQESKSILNYGLSGIMIENLEEEYENFENAYIIYSEAKRNKNKIIQKYKALCNKNQNILKDKIDLLVWIFETKEPDFYKVYKTLRVVRKKGIGKGKVKKTEKPVEKVLKTTTVEAKKENTPEETKVNSEPKLIETKKAPVIKKTRSTPVVKPRTSRATKTTKVTKAPVKVKTTVQRKKVVPKATEQKEEIAKS
jgi:hypothetical protein